MPNRFGSVVAHTDLDGEVSGSSPGHTKDLKNGTYCSSACAGHNELENALAFYIIDDVCLFESYLILYVLFHKYYTLHKTRSIKTDS